MSKRLLITLGALLGALVLRNATAQAPVPDPVAYLTDRGIAVTEDSLRAAWIERAWGNADRFVYGFRVNGDPDGGELDFYFDAASGTLLDNAALLALGIVPKPRETATAATDAEVVDFAHKDTAPRAKTASIAARIPTIMLPPVDQARLLAEDETRGEFERGRLRLGVAEDLPEPITRVDFEKSGLRKDRVTALAVSAPGALGLRLHFTLETPNAASTLRVYDPARPAEAFAPDPGDAEWWSPTCWADTVVVECDDTFEGGFVLDRALQVYRTPDAQPEKAAGACEVDVSCQERWHDIALGVGGLGTIDLDEFIFCTASLLVDANASTAVPYLLTANHCVSSTSQASPLEVYWLYQTPACGGAPPNLGDVPRTTGGAVFLAGNGNLFGTDLSFLRLKRNPPSGLTWLGWETAAPAIGADVTCIHHPEGDFKRISFGNTEDRGEDRLRPAARYHEVTWRTGVTEPGSSGSPLFLSSTQRIIGQLYGGTSACRSPHEPDYYGRFDVSYFMIQNFLGALPNPYDVNGDHAVNSADLQTVVTAALNRPNSAKEDLDGNGRVNATDIQIMVVAVLSFSG